MCKKDNSFSRIPTNKSGEDDVHHFRPIYTLSIVILTFLS
jgi:hypothetical protein